MKKYILQFSGGKDSLATLEWWRQNRGLDDVLVVYANTGAAYPETLEVIEKVKAKVPHFFELKTNQPKWIEENGYPTDVLPINNTIYGKQVIGDKAVGPKLQSWGSCCSANLWQPMANLVKLYGFKHVIRGTRDEETQKAPFNDGDVVDGVTYHLPIQKWKTDEVFQYLKDNGIDVPAFYGAENTSRDCWSCTAFLGDGTGNDDYKVTKRILSLPEPQRTIVTNRLKEIKVVVESYISPIDNILNQIGDTNG